MDERRLSKLWFEKLLSDNYIKPEILAHKYGVLDAIINKEYWLLDEIKPIDDFLIDIKEYTYGSGIMINGKEHTTIENLKYEIANEFGVNLGPDATSRANGSVGGEITRRLVQNGMNQVSGSYQNK